jgi:hypothetical protein
MKVVLAILFSLLAGGCSTHSNLNQTNRPSAFGGFKDQTLAEGLFLIEGTSGVAPWENAGGARKIFERRARELCGDDRFTILWMYEETGTPLGLRLYKTTTIVGYVCDTDSPLSIDEAKRIINEQRSEAWLFQISDWLK